MHSLEDFARDNATASESEGGSEQAGATSNLKESTHHYYDRDKLAKKKTWLTRLREVNWKNIVIMACLWLAVLLCSMAYSIVAPFFPSKVRNICSICCDHQLL